MNDRFSRVQQVLELTRAESGNAPDVTQALDAAVSADLGDDRLL